MRIEVLKNSVSFIVDDVVFKSEKAARQFQVAEYMQQKLAETLYILESKENSEDKIKHLTILHSRTKKQLDYIDRSFVDEAEERNEVVRKAIQLLRFDGCLKEDVANMLQGVLS